MGVKEQKEFINSSINPQTEEEAQELNSLSSYFNGFLKGSIKGITGVGRMGGPLLETETGEEEKAARNLEKMLPTNKDNITGGIQRASNILPYLASGGGRMLPTLLQAALGGAAGQGAEAAGLGPIPQAIAEILPTLGASFGRRIPSSQGNIRRAVGENVERIPGMGKIGQEITSSGEKAAQEAELIAGARKLGLSEEDIAKSIGGKSDFLIESARKGSKTQKEFQQTKESLGNVWNTLRESPSAQKPLSTKSQQTFINELNESLKKLPAEQRNRVSEDISDLLSSEMKGADIIKFWQDLNYYIKKGEGGLGTVKEILKRQLNKISPELGKDFEITNNLYGRFSDLSKKVAPNIVEDLINTGEKGMLLSGMITGNYSLLQHTLGLAGGRKLAEIMIRKPHFHNISQRLINGLNSGKLYIASEAYHKLLNEVAKYDVEVAKKLSGISDEDINKIFMQTKSKEQGKK